MMTLLITTVLIITLLIMTLLIMTLLITTLLIMTILITIDTGDITYNLIINDFTYKRKLKHICNVEFIDVKSKVYISNIVISKIVMSKVVIIKPL
jgi:hypothetical protein